MGVQFTIKNGKKFVVSNSASSNTNNSVDIGNSMSMTYSTFWNALFVSTDAGMVTLKTNSNYSGSNVIFTPFSGGCGFIALNTTDNLIYCLINAQDLYKYNPGNQSLTFVGSFSYSDSNDKIGYNPYNNHIYKNNYIANTISVWDCTNNVRLSDITSTYFNNPVICNAGYDPITQSYFVGQNITGDHGTRIDQTETVQTVSLCAEVGIPYGTCYAIPALSTVYFPSDLSSDFIEAYNVVSQTNSIIFGVQFLNTIGMSYNTSNGVLYQVKDGYYFKINPLSGMSIINTITDPLIGGNADALSYIDSTINRLFIINSSNYIYVYDLNTDTPLTTITTGVTSVNSEAITVNQFLVNANQPPIKQFIISFNGIMDDDVRISRTRSGVETDIISQTPGDIMYWDYVLSAYSPNWTVHTTGRPGMTLVYPVTSMNRQWNVGWYGGPDYNINGNGNVNINYTGTSLIPGDIINVYGVDAWQGGWSMCTWAATAIYDNTQVKYFSGGGISSGITPLTGNGYRFGTGLLFPFDTLTDFVYYFAGLSGAPGQYDAVGYTAATTSPIGLFGSGPFFIDYHSNGSILL